MRASIKLSNFVGLVAASFLPLIVNQDFGANSHDPSAGFTQSKSAVNPVGPGANSIGDNGVKFVGTNACVFCHKDGHNFPTHAVAGKEYSVWVNEDPHSCAYNVLFGNQSLSIARNLNHKIPPHQNEICLNCHATNASQHQLAVNSQLSLVDGVGCESCHGGAENWLVAHKLPDWKYYLPSEKESLGFVDTDNIATRARKCVECHVGSPGRDVNHDLIAAGHPRLYFEMSAYHSKIPRHWSRAKDLQQNSVATETRLWLVGQFVSAAASLDLLNLRISKPDSPWPEFSEYGCFSCHHDLADQQWKANRSVFSNGVGKPVWGTWHFSMIENLAQNLNLAEASDLANEIRAVKDAMQTTSPDRGFISSKIVDLGQRLNHLADHFAQIHLDELVTLEVSEQLYADGIQFDRLNWDVLMQQYLAAVALRQSLMDSRWATRPNSNSEFEASKQRLLDIRESLKFKEDFNGPGKITAAQRRSINQSFSAIFEQLKN